MTDADPVLAIWADCDPSMRGWAEMQKAIGALIKTEDFLDAAVAVRRDDEESTGQVVPDRQLNNNVVMELALARKIRPPLADATGLCADPAVVSYAGGRRRGLGKPPDGVP